MRSLASYAKLSFTAVFGGHGRSSCPLELSSRHSFCAPRKGSAGREIAFLSNSPGPPFARCHERLPVPQASLLVLWTPEILSLAQVFLSWGPPAWPPIPAVVLEPLTPLWAVRLVPRLKSCPRYFLRFHQALRFPDSRMDESKWR